MATFKCDICGKEKEGYWNNPAPLEGKKCCDECNKQYVIPARLKQIKTGNKLEDNIGEVNSKIGELDKVRATGKVDEDTTDASNLEESSKNEYEPATVNEPVKDDILGSMTNFASNVTKAFANHLDEAVEEQKEQYAVTDAFPVNVDKVVCKKGDYTVLECSENGKNKHWLVVKNKNYSGEKVYTGGGIVEYSASEAIKTAEHFNIMNGLDNKYGPKEGYKRWIAGKTDEDTTEEVKNEEVKDASRYTKEEIFRITNTQIRLRKELKEINAELGRIKTYSPELTSAMARVNLRKKADLEERIANCQEAIDEYNKSLKDEDTTENANITVGTKYHWEERYPGQTLTVMEADEKIKLSLDNSNITVKMPINKFNKLVEEGTVNASETAELTITDSDGQVYRRTFEALKYPKGSAERAKLNQSCVTSEYGTSHKYAAVGKNYSLTFATKAEAEAFVNSSVKDDSPFDRGQAYYYAHTGDWVEINGKEYQINLDHGKIGYSNNIGLTEKTTGKRVVITKDDFIKKARLVKYDTLKDSGMRDMKTVKVETREHYEAIVKGWSGEPMRVTVQTGRGYVDVYFTPKNGYCVPTGVTGYVTYPDLSGAKRLALANSRNLFLTDSAIKDAAKLWLINSVYGSKEYRANSEDDAVKMYMKEHPKANTDEIRIQLIKEVSSSNHTAKLISQNIDSAVIDGIGVENLRMFVSPAKIDTSRMNSTGEIVIICANNEEKSEVERKLYKNRIPVEFEKGNKLYIDAARIRDSAIKDYKSDDLNKIIKEKFQRLGKDKIEKYKAQLKATGGYKVLGTRLIWDLLHMTVGSREVSDWYDKYDVNDDHITSAGRKALKEMGISLD